MWNLNAASDLFTEIPYFLKAHNASLRGEQRRPPNLNHCAVITKAESNPKCRALGIPLERFVM
ncbi:hypothetical protein F7U80_23365 [Vibrio parahaemolyticus]|nr:hypothetical protein [Vibrio parahaemolyticus]